MNDRDLQTQLDAYLNRFATFAAPPLAVRIPGRRGRGLKLLGAVAVVAVVAVVLAAPIVLTRFQSQHRAPAVRPQPTANVSPRPPLHHNGQIVMGIGTSLIAIDPATGHEQVIPSLLGGDPVASPAWSPDGTKVAYLQGYSIWVLDTTTGHAKQLTTCHGCSPINYISWSPDSSRLAFSEADQRGSFQLHLIDADGTHRAQLTHFPATQNATQPTWSPDGTRIAFTFFSVANVPNQGEVFPTVNIDVIRPDGTGLAVLLAANGQGGQGPYLYPAWSPNDSRIAYLLDPLPPTAGANFQYQLWLMNPDGSHRTEIFRYNGCCVNALGGPAWSPDGTRIAAVTSQTLWVMNADGSDPTSLGGISADRPAWQPVP
jgi:WD40 repeat protein